MPKANKASLVKKEAAAIMASGKPFVPAFAFAPGTKNKVYLAELQRIRDEYGALTPEILIPEAQNKDSPLHDHPEWKGWDVKAITTAYLRLAASKIIARAHIKIIKDPRADRRPMRAIVTVVPPSGIRERMSIFEALGNEDYKEQLIRRELAAMRRSKERLRDYHELADIVEALDAAIEKAEEHLTKAKKK